MGARRHRQHRPCRRPRGVRKTAQGSNPSPAFLSSVLFLELNTVLFVAIAISSYRRGSLQSPGASALSSEEGLGRSIQGADALRYTPPTLLSVGIRGLSLLSSQCRQVINYPEIFPQKKNYPEIFALLYSPFKQSQKPLYKLH